MLPVNRVTRNETFGGIFVNFHLVTLPVNKKNLASTLDDSRVESVCYKLFETETANISTRCTPCQEAG